MMKEVNWLILSGLILSGIFAFALSGCGSRHHRSMAGSLDSTPPPEGMVLIPAGQFQMGSEAEDADAQRDANPSNPINYWDFDTGEWWVYEEHDEDPVHTVHIDAFFMDAHEVTNLEYKAFLLENPRWQKSRIDTQFHGGSYLEHWSGNNYPPGKANHPVTYVSWYAAMAYAAWAGKRLPTEAEWEYAARGGLAGKKYPWGNTLTHNDANYTSGDTTSVGRYAANGYGLYDMAGNVWEWCLDEYDRDFYARSRNSRNPLSGARTIQWILDNFTSIPYNSLRVCRGGGWVFWKVRVAYRGWFEPILTNKTLGFRCVRGTVTP